MRRVIAALALATAAVAPRFAAARAIPADDTQWWQELDVTTNLAPDLRVTASGFTRFGDGLPNPTLVGGALGTVYASGHWSYGAGVLYATVRSAASGARIDVELPYAAVTGSVELGGFILSDRLRIEDLIGLKDDPWRYRNQLGVSRHLGRDPRSLYVFATDEVFVDVNTERFTRNRWLSGIGMPLGARAVVETAYLNQDNAGQRPGRIQGMSVTVKVTF